MEENRWPFDFFEIPQVMYGSPFQVIAHSAMLIMEDLQGKFMPFRALACINFLQVYSPSL
jgi:hypothetical protein